MSTKHIDALKLALEALEEIADEVFSAYDNKLGGAILAIREALAQPEPSAYWHSEFLKYNTTSDHRMMENAQGDLERIKLVQTGVGIGKPNGCQCPACKIAPHASDCPVHNEPAWPNGPCDCGARPEQEPVAHVYLFEPNGRPRVAWDNAKDIKIGDKLYTAPPQRKPLTDEEISDAVREADFDWHYGWTLDDEEPNRFTKFARAIEAAHGIKGDA